ncbi:MAG: peptidoglycan DD-metalloendopeptidase family protein [Chloroflexi bacterium]|nr:peptidoglycan DD-metalloendopeptidase family protein [Chloroflexota bacterium]
MHNCRHRRPWLSGRLLVSVLALAIVSATVGAGAALLLRPANEPAQTSSRVTVVATTPPPDASEQPQAQPAERPSHKVEQSPTSSAPAAGTAPEEVASQEQSTTASTQPSAEQHAESQEAEESQPVEQTAAQQEQQASDIEVDPPPEVQPRFAITTTPARLTQGEALALTGESEQASAVAATIGGRSWNLIQTAPGLWWTVIAIPRDADTGTTAVVVDLYAEDGDWLRSASASVVVLANAAPLEEVTLGGTGTPADPADVARDIAVRFSDHISVSGPPRWNGPWILPVEGEVTGVFGAQRTYDGVQAQGWHHGHDIAAQHGDPIVAPAPGTVVWTGEVILHGIGVIIDHGAGVYSGYWHMSLIAVREGMDVAPGDWLGNIGNTGLSTGPHLHWEVIIQGVDVDPVQWLGDDRPPLPPVAPDSEQTADTLD